MKEESESVANPLTLIMDIKSDQDYTKLNTLILGLQSQSSGTNPIRQALDELGMVHFARFVFLGREKLAVITSYDGSFEQYIGAFTRKIGPIFDQLLSHMKDAPPLPVAENREAFLRYVKERDLQCVQPFYSAYPDLTVQQILTLRKKAEG